MLLLYMKNTQKIVLICLIIGFIGVLGVFGYSHSKKKEVPITPVNNTLTVQPSIEQRVAPTQLTNNKTTDRVLGILEIPGFMYDESHSGENLNLKKPLKIYDTPKGGTLVATITNLSEVEVKEYGYEEIGPTIYGVESESYKIKLTNGAQGWLKKENGYIFHSVENLLRNSLTYLTPVWDRKLYNNIDMMKAQIYGEQQESKDTTVYIKETKKDKNGQLWMNVEIITGSCTGEEKSVANGWVSLYNSHNDLNLWYYSRGC